MTDAQDYYGLLGANPAADFAELKSCYFARAKECHPDLFGGDPDKTEAFKLLVNAFHVLSDPVQRRKYDEKNAWRQIAEKQRGPGPSLPLDDQSILDRFSDDILEELIVGNTVPDGTTIQTLFRDLERTARFVRFREAKNLYYRKQFAAALDLFGDGVIQAPQNILARYFFAHCLAEMKRFKEAELQLEIGLKLGAQRDPPLILSRLRRDLLTLRRKKLGLAGRLRSFFFDPPPDPPPLMDDNEKMRRTVSRIMTDMAREDQVKAAQAAQNKLEPPPPK